MVRQNDLHADKTFRFRDMMAVASIIERTLYVCVAVRQILFEIGPARLCSDATSVALLQKPER